MSEAIENRNIGEKNVEEDALTNVDIGNAAGVIWRFLDPKTETVNLSALKSNLPVSSSLLTMGLGWLAREDKLIIEKSENSPSYRISLKR